MPLCRAAVIATSIFALGACEYDNVTPNADSIVDSVAVATARGPGTAGRLMDLMGDRWKAVAVLDAQAAEYEVANLVGERRAKEFNKLIARDSSGTVLIFQYMHGSTQTVFIPRSRATFAPDILGKSFSHYWHYTIDSASQIVVRPRQ